MLPALGARPTATIINCNDFFSPWQGTFFRNLKKPNRHETGKGDQMNTGYRYSFLIALVVALLISGCATVPTHNPLPNDLEGAARLQGMPENARFWGDAPPPWIDRWNTASREVFLSEYGGVMGREHNYLAISGGGANGAFGAGLLVGWSAAGTRPEFTIVTGISTGALIAPFAFLGSAYDAQLEEVYTNYSTGDLIKRRRIWALTGDAVYSTRPLQDKIAKYFNKQVIEAIADEGRKGRTLFIGTSDLEADRPVIWNITRIASSGDPGALELIHKVILASASIPVAFPPVIIEVEANGQRYNELHADGGTSTQIFLYPVGVKWDLITNRLDVKGTPKAFLIRNAYLHPARRTIQPRMIPIANRAISSLIRTQGIGDMYRMYFSAQRDGIDYHLAYIPDEFDERPKEMFDPVYMRKLFDLGYQMGKSKFPWHKAPPGFESP
jgi:predicted acylesterase/phospholipase RssA